MTPPDDETLVAFVDGELDAGAARSVAAMVAADPVLADKVRRLRDSAQAVRMLWSQPAYRQVSPRALRAVTPLRHGRRLLGQAAAAALLLAGGFGAGVLATNGATHGATHGAAPPSPPHRLLEEIADYHAVYSRESEHQAEIGADRVAEIEDWLGRRLSRRLVVPDLTARWLTFHGARLLVIDGNPVAELFYHQPDRPHEPLGLCITFAPGGNTEPRSAVTDGLNQVVWHRNGYAYVLVGMQAPELLRSLSTQLMTELDG